MKKILYIFLVSLFFFTALDVGAVNFGLERIDDDLKSTADGQNITLTITSIVAYIVGFFYLIALIFGIYAGFLIMTSGGDEERVKKGKNIFIYVIIGLIVVFLASTIIRFVVNALEGEAFGEPSNGVGIVIEGSAGFNFPQGSAPDVEYIYPGDDNYPGGKRD